MFELTLKVSDENRTALKNLNLTFVETANKIKVLVDTDEQFLNVVDLG